MRISIAMCTHNGAQYLQRQLDSFASQTHQPDELVVCDDGSTDDTLSLIDIFAKKVTFPVRIIRNARKLGPTKNFEKAIRICDGHLVALSDQDDEWYSHKLAEMHRLFEEFPRALAAFSDADLIDEHSVPMGRNLWESFFFKPLRRVPHLNTEIIASIFRLNHIAAGATMVFRSAFRSQFVPIPESWFHDAWIAWIAALRGGLASFPSPTIRYRIHTRQQVGIPPPSLLKQLAFARRNADAFRQLALSLQDLRLYMEKHKEDKQFSKYILELDAKIKHLESRASLSGSVLHRLSWILRSWREYQRYARGPISMFSDALIVSSSSKEMRVKC